MMKISKLFKSESGATAIEYGLIAALIALAIFVGAKMAGNGLDTMFQTVGGTLQNAAQDIETN
ncbi:MAG: Flp family type IVb pilin [Rhodospirillaceae bacterium]|nr:Flp family type IVb pilin [Rhodospirillaceae bacterium]